MGNGQIPYRKHCIRGKHPKIGQNRAAAMGNGNQNTPKLKIARPTINEKENKSRWETFALEWEKYKMYNGLKTRDMIQRQHLTQSPRKTYSNI